MTIRIEPANLGHFPAVYDRLLRPLNAGIPRDRWRRLFDQPWAMPDDLPGQVMLDRDRVVGYVAFIHSYVPGPADGQEHLVNVSSWVVDPAYSHKATALIVPVLRMTDATVTNLTNIPSVHDMFTKLGFGQLESRIRIMVPVPWPSPWGRVDVVTNVEEILPALSGWERMMAADHRWCCRHLLLREAGGRHCYAMFTFGRRKGVRTARLYWVTPGTLEEGSIALRQALLRHFGCPLVELDDRFAPPHLPGSFSTRLAVPRVFRSPRLLPREVPAVYSELTMLELW